MNFRKIISLVFILCFILINDADAYYQRIGIRALEKCTIPAGAKTGKMDAYCLDEHFIPPNTSISYSIIETPNSFSVRVGKNGKPMSLAEAKKRGLLNWTIDYEGGVDFHFIRGRNAGNLEINISTSDVACFNTPENTNPAKYPSYLYDDDVPLTTPVKLDALKASIEDIDRYTAEAEQIIGKTDVSYHEKMQSYIWKNRIRNVQEKLTERGFYHGSEEADLKATKEALRAYNRSIGIDENKIFDKDIFEVTRYIAVNKSEKKYLYVRKKADHVLVGYDKLYQIPLEDIADNDNRILEAAVNIVKPEDKNIVLIDNSYGYWGINVNELATGLQERYPEKTFYTTAAFEPEFEIYNTTISNKDVGLYYYPDVTGIIGPTGERLEQFRNNGLSVITLDGLFSIPAVEKKVIITLGDNDYKYHNYLRTLDGKLKDKTLISVACYREGDNGFYYNLKEINGIRHIVHFSTLIDPVAADRFILRISKYLHDNATEEELKRVLDKVINELIHENPGNAKYEVLRKYIISLHYPNRQHNQNKYYNYEHTKTIFYC